MFSNRMKNYFIKRNVKNKLSNVKHIVSENVIQTIGIIIDEKVLENKENLISEIKKFGFQESQIEYIVFKDRVKKTDVFDYPFFTIKDVTWNPTFENKVVLNFISKKFDLLINYYNSEKAPLLLATSLSNAQFKVGFKEIDHRLNHFIINENPINFKVFTAELFKYLKILKKI